MIKKYWLLVAYAFCLIRVSHGVFGNVPLASIEMTQLDDDAIAYATFQSHNQKVVSNDWRIFTTHNRTANVGKPYYSAQQWRLSQSSDGGRTFKTVYESMTHSHPPTIETDGAGNLYVIDHPMPQKNYQARLNIFPAGSDFTTPKTTVIPKGASGKYAMVVDEKRKQVYYISQNKSFHITAIP